MMCGGEVEEHIENIDDCTARLILVIIEDRIEVLMNMLMLLNIVVRL